MSAPTIVGAVVVRNEDLWVETAIRNVADFCDVIHVADNGSTDGTWELLQALAGALEHLDLRRVANVADSQELVGRYVGSDCWVFGIDGDELYDPAGLAVLREELRGGAYRDKWRIKSNVLNAVAVDREAMTATGHLAPPSRPITKLFNFAALEAWTGPFIQVLHGDGAIYRPGYAHDASENIGDRLDWGTSYFRCLHCCFVRRSSLEGPTEAVLGRPSPIDVHRAAHGGVRDRLTRLKPGARSRSRWKNQAYRRGELATVDVRAFLGTQISS